MRGSASLENNLAKQLSAVASDVNHNDIKFKLVIIGESRAIRPEIQYEVFRIGAEAMSNAFRHSDATAIRVEVGYLNGLRVSVQDNGKGMPGEVLHRGREGHFGLEGIRERADRIGAKLDVYSRAGEGTEVTLIVPGHIAFGANGNSPSPLVRVILRLMTRNRKPADDSQFL